MKINDDESITLESEEVVKIASLLVLQNAAIIANRELEKALLFWKTGAILNLIVALLLMFIK